MFAPPRGLSQLATAFIASQLPGIHHEPLSLGHIIFSSGPRLSARTFVYSRIPRSPFPLPVKDLIICQYNTTDTTGTDKS